MRATLVSMAKTTGAGVVLGLVGASVMLHVWSMRYQRNFGFRK